MTCLSRRTRLCIFLISGFALASSIARCERVDFVWPTPNTAFFDGKGIEAFIQPTASGEPDSGLFGCHRSGGRQFHEGLDLKPVHRARNGEPTDDVSAAMAGVVRHINRTPGDSNYGRYIVVEHPTTGLLINTLYAHLSAIAPGLKVGDTVERGQVIGVMGRSSSVFAIPKDRAHLHFEMNLLISRNFQSWYNWKRFGSRNEHGLWNGMNLVGFDPLDFLTAYRAHNVDDFVQYLTHLKPAVRVKIATRFIPDFVERNPALLTRPIPTADAFGGWEILFNEVGMPFAWTPLSPIDVVGLDHDEVQVAPVDPDAKLPHCKSLVFKKRGRYAVGRDLETMLQLLFNLHRDL